MFYLISVENTVAYLPDVYSRWTFMAILNATVAVDTFFALRYCTWHNVFSEKKQNIYCVR